MLPKRKGLSRLAIFYKSKKAYPIRNKFYSKAQCFRANFSEISIINVNFKGAILTSCNFKKTIFHQVSFLGSNLKKSNFTNAIFKNCIFSGALMEKCNFKDSTFENCIFVNTNLSNSKSLIIGENNKIFTKNPVPTIDMETVALIDKFKTNPKISNYRVLHLRGGKINNLTLYVLLDRFGESNLKTRLKNLNGALPRRIITAHDLCSALDKARKPT